MSDRKALKEEKKLQKQQKFLQKQTKHVINAPKDRKAHKSAVPIPDIPFGAMKDLTFTPSSFDPLYVETGWYNWWLKNDFFKPSDATEKFVICIPPPNVTGKLHIGHAMMAAIQDTLVRYHRMTGKSVLYLPGTDHAGIATQAVVERKLLQNGILKNSLTRNEFVQEIFKWKDENGDAIFSQLQRLGLSCDFSRQVFTLDKNYSSAVTEAFNILYERKYIYRKEKMVNWCGKMKTTLSDLEVDVKEITANTFIDVDGGKYEFGVMYHFLYPIVRHKEGANEVFFVEVCTTRPETILGDTALCLNPSDKRYDFDGCHAYNFLTKQFIKIVYDDYCDINFGSGIVKITPCHDSNDFEVAQRNGLKGINILNEDNCIDIESLLSTIKEGENTIDNLNLENMKFDTESKVDKEIFDKDISFLESLHTVKRFEARKMVVEYLKEKHLLIDKKAHSHALPFCSRSNDIIEPRIKKQWWMDCKDFAEKAKEVVRVKEIKISPSESEKVYFNWLDNIRDWCLSRQLVWGHRIPAYRVYKNKTKIGWVVGRNIDDAIVNAIRLGTENEIETDEKNDNKNHNADNKMHSDVCINEDMSGADFTYKDANYKIEQDEDVLDTWFSSALWPFATLGWPDETEDYARFFPTSLLETGSDILFFWVARMVMLSLELTGKVPFKNTLLHGIVRDAHGKKMSKSLGNIIDPIFIIEGRTLKQLNESIANVNEAERKRAASAQAKDFPNGIPCCGTDALRFTLCAYNNGIKDVNLDVLRVEGYRRMGNKIWNAFKFIKMIVESDSPCDEKSKDTNESCNPNMHIKWITNRLRETRVAMKESYESYNLMNATQVIYSFFLYDFCDVFIEIIKKRKETLDKETAFLVFIDILKMMHPIMPYLTEELYQRLKMVRISFYNFKQSISIDTFPDSKITDHGELDSKIEDLDISNNAIFIEILEVVKGIRSIVDSHGIKTFVVETDNKAAAYYIGVMIKCDVTVNDDVKGQYVDSIGSIRYGIYDPNHPENEHVDSEDN